LSKRPEPRKYFNILQAKRAYSEGKNVTHLLRAQANLQANSPEIIEIAYDLQAGTYIESVNEHRNFSMQYAKELADIVQAHVNPGDCLLDVGTGEITTLSLMTRNLTKLPTRVFAFDISWSRIYKGLTFAREHMGDCFAQLTAFVADMSEIPLPDKSVNITTSSHALEPNGSILPLLLAELFRVTRDKLLLFEPCYEINTEQGQMRMEQMGYIKGLDRIAKSLGGILIDRIAMKNVSNPLNPTACYIIQPPFQARAAASNDVQFSLPGSSLPLRRVEDFYYSDSTGYCFPILKSIPILKSSAAILASALARDDADGSIA
jgi:SAM-dependent methyltransferase